MIFELKSLWRVGLKSPFLEERDFGIFSTLSLACKRFKCFEAIWVSEKLSNYSYVATLVVSKVLSCFTFCSSGFIALYKEVLLLTSVPSHERKSCKIISIKLQDEQIITQAPSQQASRTVLEIFTEILPHRWKIIIF